MFLTLSLLKGAADVIEGSTVNVNMILGMQIEVGDIIQPVYDMINIIWKISLASVVVLKIQTIYQEIFRVKLATILIFISLVSYLPYTVFKNSITEIFKKISKYSFFVLIYIYTVIPGTIFVNSMISNYFEKEYKTPAIVQLNQNLNRLNNVKDSMLSLDQNKSIFNIPGQIDTAKQKINNLPRKENTSCYYSVEFFDREDRFSVLDCLIREPCSKMFGKVMFEVKTIGKTRIFYIAV